MRYQSASDVRADLKRLKPDAASASLPRWRLWALIGTAALVAAGVLAYLFVLPAPPPRIGNFKQITTDGKPKSRILTDGSRVYSGELDYDGLVLRPVQVSASGGDVAAIASHLPDGLLLDISRDGSELLLITGISKAFANQPLPLWVLPVLGTSPRRVGTVMACDAAWEPDGEHIIYSNLDALYVVRRDGSGSHKFATVTGIAHNLHWSPEGSRLRFDLTEPKASSSSLWEVSADGTHLHPLLPVRNERSSECCGNWTPDGKYFVFVSGSTVGICAGGGANLWARCEKASLFRRCPPEPVQLTAGPLNFSGVIPSPDGKKLFVVGSQNRVELIRYDAKSDRFAPYLAGISADGVGFSRDGRWAAYVGVPEGTVWRSKVDGSERLQLTFPPLAAGNPRWSPDGREIAFQALVPGSHPLKSM